MLKQAITLFIVLICPAASAQAPNWQWAKNGVGTAWEYGTAVCTDGGGNVFITGHFQSPAFTLGGITLFKAGSSNVSTDIFIAKYNAGGNLLWAKSAGGIGSEAGNGICTDASGNVFITGYFDSPTLVFGSTTLTANGFTDFFIAKFDAAGNELWARSAGESGTDEGKGICTDNSGNVCVTGYFSAATITFGSYTLTNSGNTDVFTVKYNTAGTVLWARVAGGASDEAGNSVSADATGNIFIAGSYKSLNIVFGATTLTNTDNTGSSQDIFVAKYDAAGNLLWARSGAGPAFDYGEAICTDGAGNAFVTGSFQSAIIALGSNTLANTGGADLFVAKYDAAGNALWLKSTVGFTGNNESGKGLSSDAAGNILVTGYYTTPTITLGGFTLTNMTITGIYSDIFVAKYDAAGSVLWAKSIGGTVSDVPSSICTSIDGSVYITGGFQSATLAIGSTTLNNSFVNPNSPISDVFLAKLESTSANGIAEKADLKVMDIFPNPFSEQLTLRTGVYLQNASLILDNSTGKTVKQLNGIWGREIILFRDRLPSGVYFLRLLQDYKMIACRKIIIED